MDVWGLLSAVLFVIFSYWKRKVQKKCSISVLDMQLFDFEKQWSSAVLKIATIIQNKKLQLEYVYV